MAKYGRIIKLERTAFKDVDKGQIRDLTTGRIYPFKVGRSKYRLGDEVKYAPLPGSLSPEIQKGVKEVKIMD